MRHDLVINTLNSERGKLLIQDLARMVKQMLMQAERGENPVYGQSVQVNFGNGITATMSLEVHDHNVPLPPMPNDLVTDEVRERVASMRTMIAEIEDILENDHE